MMPFFGTAICRGSMDVVLKVLEGAKVGTKIAIKKSEFLIGRSPKCHLCAGSSSISRQHCAFLRKDSTVHVKDLGSRNGTIVNGKKLKPEKEYELSSGDEIAVGSLRFLLTISHGVKNEKRPQVKSVAEAVERTAASSSGTFVEDDISNWLLGDPGKKNQTFTETQTIRMDDTKAANLKDLQEQEDSDEQSHSASDSSVLSETSHEAPEEGEGKDEEEDDKNKKPGKLPPRPAEPASKDSREAAMMALRNWNRRR